MKFIILILSLLSLSFCEYKELKKHSSVKVVPDTKVFLDLSSFETGELISFEIEMDLFFGDNTDYYEFWIDQVPATSSYDSNYWNHLRKVKNENVSCDGDRECTFTWEEIKQEGNTYIYIITPAPFRDFYTFWDKKIKITHLGGGLSAGAIVGIVFGVIAFIVIIIIIIACCCCSCHPNGRCCLCCSCCNCCCCRKTYYGTVVQANIPYQQPVYPPPVAVPVPVGPVTPVTPIYSNPAPVYPVTGQVYPPNQPYTSLPGYM